MNWARWLANNGPLNAEDWYRDHSNDYLGRERHELRRYSDEDCHYSF